MSREMAVCIDPVDPDNANTVIVGIPRSDDCDSQSPNTSHRFQLRTP